MTEKTCVVCGKPIEFKHWESESRKASRIYCSSRCGGLKASGRAEEFDPTVEEIWRKAAELRAARTTKTPEDDVVPYQVPQIAMGVRQNRAGWKARLFDDSTVAGR